MELFLTFLSFLGGLALFLYGMRTMGDALKRGSGNTLKRVLGRLTGSNLNAFLLGLVVTCIIQSSTATIVLTVGLVGAGMLTYKQSIGIVVGANVGTTITAQIIRLLDINADATGFLSLVKPSTLAPLALVVGMVIIMFIKNSTTSVSGSIAVGFGIIFTGLMNMTAAVTPLTESAAFTRMLTAFTNVPVLGFLIGLVVTIVVQSSSAVVGMLQAISLSGTFTFKTIYALMIGINIGDCTETYFLCRIGGNTDQRRVGMFHVVYNIFGALFLIVVILLGRSLGLFDTLWDKVMHSGDIANVHAIFRLSVAAVLFPFLGLIDRLTCRIIPEKADVKPAAEPELKMLDENLFISPALALASARDAIVVMSATARTNTELAFGLFRQYDPAVMEQIYANEGHIDHLADSVDNYLIKLSTRVTTAEQNDRLNYLIQTFSEFERIGDLAVNIAENATELNEKGLVFSDVALQEMDVIRSAIKDILDVTHETITEPASGAARRIEPIEEVVDDLVAVLKTRHIERLRAGQCRTYAGLIFLDALTNIERIADQCSNIGVYTISLSNPEAKMSHHDYISTLHKGADTAFVSAYEANHRKYFGALPEQGE